MKLVIIGKHIRSTQLITSPEMNFDRNMQMKKKERKRETGSKWDKEK